MRARSGPRQEERGEVYVLGVPDFLRVSNLGLELRAAVRCDAERIGDAVAAGFQSYLSFAPGDWTPRPAAAETDLLRGLLEREDFWCLLALGAGDVLVGHVAFLPAIGAWRAVQDPTLAHLRQLFLAPERWGTGLARTLHTRAMQAAWERGFTAMRLFTPVGQARARVFYEREGWAVHGEAFCDPGFGLKLVEYRRSLR